MIGFVIDTALHLMTNAAVKRHDPCDNAVDLFGRFLFTRFDVFRGIHFSDHIASHPAEYRVATVYKFAFEQQLIQFFHRGRHILEAHAHRNDCETVAFKVGDKLCCIPSIGSNFFDVIMTLCIGMFGYLMIKGGFPTAPVVLGLVLGSMFEGEFRRALKLSEGSLNIFVTHPVAFTFIAIGMIIILHSIYKSWKQNNAATT